MTRAQERAQRRVPGRAARQHLDDYQVTADGGYAYQGTLLTWGDAGVREKDLKAALLGLVQGIAGALVAGFVPAPGAGFAFYVLIPYAAALVLGALLCYRLFRLVREGDPVRDYVLSSVTEGGVALALAAAVCAGVGGVGELAHAALAGAFGMPAALFALALGLSCLGYLRLWQRLRSMSLLQVVPPRA